MRSLDHLVVSPGRTIRETMGTIDRGREAIALVVNADGTLEGTVSDGDIRRALLHGADLEDPISPYISRSPTVVRQGSGRAEVLDLMRSMRLHQIPVLDEAGRLVGLHVMQEILGGEARPNWAVLLAGGRGSRLGALTDTIPKPMVPVAGRPILERIVLHLVGSGIATIYLAVNYLAEQIEEHFGDGSELGCSIRYLAEDPNNPLGTGGPLRLLQDLEGPWSDPLLVINGDLVTSFSVSSILERHEAAEAVMTVALKEYVHDVPFGVAKLDDSDPQIIERLEEKPRWTGLVNAGIYVVEPEPVRLIPAGETYPITDLIGDCLGRGQRVACWRLTGEWHDIGRPQQLERARGA